MLRSKSILTPMLLIFWFKHKKGTVGYTVSERQVTIMAKNTFSGKNSKNAYDDGNIPEIDLPQKSSNGLEVPNVEPLPESERPRKDGPGGE